MSTDGEVRKRARDVAFSVVRPVRKTYAYGFRRRWRISPHDAMFRWSAPKEYLATGRSALACISECLPREERAELRRVLDFGCGYGRVLRILTTAFPEATITATDVNAEAVDFCARTFGAVGVVSSNDPRAIHFDATFDLIWAGSVFTHLNKDLWEALLPVLGGALLDTGVLIFSTHGPDVEARIRRGEVDYGLEQAALGSILQEYGHTGFGYGDYPGLETAPFRHLSRYGITVVDPSVVRSLVDAAGLRVFHYIPTGWGNHQDVFACRPMREHPYLTPA